MYTWRLLHTSTGQILCGSLSSGAHLLYRYDADCSMVAEGSVSTSKTAKYD
jgi:hypothetical protein